MICALVTGVRAFALPIFSIGLWKAVVRDTLSDVRNLILALIAAREHLDLEPAVGRHVPEQRAADRHHVAVAPSVARARIGNGRRAGKKLPAGERASALAVHITAAPIADHGDARRDIVRERAADRGLDAISPAAAELSRPISVQILAPTAGDDVEHARDRKSTRLNSSH